MLKTDRSLGRGELLLLGLASGFLFGAPLGLYIQSSYFSSKQKLMPRVEQVQQGYVAPSKLEIFCKDLDGNGEPETLMRIENQNYLLKEVDGKPVLLTYGD